MIKYFKVTNEAEARSISRAFHKATRPAGNTTDVTDTSLAWEFDVSGNCYLVVDTDYKLPVHADRSTSTAVAIRAVQKAGKITKASADNLLAVLSANPGNKVTVAQILPPEWLAASVDTIQRFQEAQALAPD